MRRCPECNGLTYHAVCPDCGVPTYVGVPVGRLPDAEAEDVCRHGVRYGCTDCWGSVDAIEWLTFKPGESPHDEDEEVWAVTDSKAELDAARAREQLGPWPGPIDGRRGGGACYS